MKLCLNLKININIIKICPIEGIILKRNVCEHWFKSFKVPRNLSLENVKRFFFKSYEYCTLAARVYNILKYLDIYNKCILKYAEILVGGKFMILDIKGRSNKLSNEAEVISAILYSALCTT